MQRFKLKITLGDNLMQITINDKQKNLGEEAVLKAKERATATLSKFGFNVISVELTVLDVNGPRGGIDKQCRVIVKLRKMDDVAASIKEETFSKAIFRAINRAERAVSRKIQRRSLREPGRRSEFGFEFYHN
ncbi:MAG: putative sigma-54 modulation protein [Mariniblastus sp.]|jgi:putative sigma-54 modulation protein